MKKKISICLIILGSVLISFGVSKIIQMTEIEPSRNDKIIKIDKKIVLEVGNTFDLEKKIRNKYGLYIESNNEEVVTVDEDGLIKAKGIGTAVITFHFDGQQQSVTIIVEDNKNKNLDYQVEFDNLSDVLFLNEEVEVKFQTTNLNDFNKIKLKSSDSNILLVKEGFKIIGLKEGEATLSIVDEGGNVRDKIRISTISRDMFNEIMNSIDEDVYGDAGESDYFEDKDDNNTLIVDDIVKSLKLELNSKRVSLNLNTSYKLESTISPENTTNKKVIWSSSDEVIASVDETGKVIGKNVGTAVITARTEDTSVEDKCIVTVISPVIDITKIQLDKTSISLKKGNSKQIFAKITPDNATNKDLVWTSANNSVATVSNGMITAVDVGYTIITAKSAKGIVGVTKVYVEDEKPLKDSSINNGEESKDDETDFEEKSRIIINNKNIEIEVNNKAFIDKTITPNYSIEKVTYTSSNEKIATVDENGVITAKSKGVATITASVGDSKDDCQVKVKENTKTKNITLTTSTQKLYIDDSTNIVAYDENGSNVTNKGKYTSSNSEIATVDDTGKVIGRKSGTVTITGQFENIKNQIKITIYDMEPTSIKLNSKYTLKTGDSVLLEANVMPINAINKTITWTSSNTEVAEVDASGMIVAKAEGTTTIIAKTSNGVEAQCLVTVSNPEIHVTSLTISKLSVSMKKGSSSKLNTTILPNNATNKTVTWSSSNSDIVTVDKDGNLTGKNVGTATITATTVNGVKASSRVIVVNPEVLATNMKLNQTKVNLNLGKSIGLVATVEPSNTTNKIIKWSSSDTSVAIVDENGKVTGKDVGTATITAMAENGVKATAVITVKVSATGVKLDKTVANVDPGKSIKLTATTEPENTSDKTITWSSSDDAIAAVDKDGKVTGKKAGIVTITAMTENGVKATATITVNVLATSVKMNKLEATINLGNTVKMSATVLPENASNKTIKWSSSDISVATVDEDGEVTGKKAGIATITATTANGKKATSKVTVKVLASGIKLNRSVANVDLGKSIDLVATVSPENATDKTVTWSSSDTSVATVSKDGKVTGKNVGTATITATTVNGNTDISKITVVKADVLATSVILNNVPTSVVVGDNILLTATVKPENSTDKTVTWSSSDTSVATVDKDGKVTGKKAGTATITVQTKNGKKDSTEITVTKAEVLAKKVELNKTKVKVDLGKSVKLTATVSPENTTDKTVTWSSSDTSIATVDKDGKVTGKKAGTVTITAKTENGVKATATITVNVPATGVKLNKTKANVDPGKSIKLTATVSPENTTDKTVTWSSSDTDIATVDKDGNVTAKKAGTVTITATTTNDKKATAEITVNVLAKSVKLSNKTGVALTNKKVTRNLGNTFKFVATVEPNNTADKTVTWSSSNEKIATVDENGRVTGKKAGTVTITATTANNKKATATVTFKNVNRMHFIEMSVNSDAILLESNGKYGLIDTGKTEKDGERILDYLKNNKIKQLEFILITHNHVDHRGNVNKIMQDRIFSVMMNEEGVNVKNLYIKTPKYKYNDVYVTYNGKDSKYFKNLKKEYDDIIEVAQNYGVKIINVESKKDGDSIKLGAMNIKLYNTKAKGEQAILCAGENINSITELIEVNGVKTYLAADLEDLSWYIEKCNDKNRKNYEEQCNNKNDRGNTCRTYNNNPARSIVNKIGKVDIYKAVHHGYGHVESDDNLNTLAPKLIVVTGSNDKEQHANRKIINYKKKNNNVKVLYTINEKYENTEGTATVVTIEDNNTYSSAVGVKCVDNRCQ